ncbi:MAG: FAD-binding protein [Candidatus Saccharimonadales bacterium]
MKILHNESLAPYTSLRVGGPAETLILVDNYDEALAALHDATGPVWFIGYGCNALISNHGLPGMTVMWRGGDIRVEDARIIADAGVWWDDVVKTAIDHQLWGLELMSEIPSSVGGAVYGNIAAYGQQVSDTLESIRVFNQHSGNIEEINIEDTDKLAFSYRSSSLQFNEPYVVLGATFRLSPTPLHELKYDAALAVGEELNLDHRTLEHCREIIIETRRRAGSIYHPDEPTDIHSAGSFFKNPMVSVEQAKELAGFDESGKTLERIINQSVVHGGNAQRASAAHVLLAAGFHRGQRWGHVELHPSHVLKLATLEGATAQEVYDVTQEIVRTVKDKLGVDLEPEVKFLGEF